MDWTWPLILLLGFAISYYVLLKKYHLVRFFSTACILSIITFLVFDLKWGTIVFCCASIGVYIAMRIIWLLPDNREKQDTIGIKEVPVGKPRKKLTLDGKNVDTIVIELTAILKKLKSGKDRVSPIVESLEIIAECYKSPLLVCILGEFSSGKSTFINAFLKENLLAMKDVETTATITRLQYGEDEKVTVFFTDGNKKEFKLQNGQRESVDKYTVENFNDNSIIQKTKFVTISLSKEILKSFDLVDTPGYNSPANKRHSELTDQFSKYADAIIWLFDEDQIGKATEVKKLSEICKYYKPVFVINKIDQIDLKPNETYDMKFRRALTKLDGTYAKVFFVSALQALQDTNGSYEKSGMSKVHDFFHKEMIPNSLKLKQDSLFIKLLDTGNSLINEYNLVNRTKGKLDEEISALHTMKLEFEGLVEKWENSLNAWNADCESTDVISILENIPRYFQVSGIPSDLLEQQELLLNDCVLLNADFDKISEQVADLNERVARLNAFYEAWANDYQTYANKGLGLKKGWDDFWGSGSGMQSSERINLNQQMDNYEEKREKYNSKVEKFEKFRKLTIEKRNALVENIIHFLNNTVKDAMNNQVETLKKLDGIIEKRSNALNARKNEYEMLCEDLMLFEYDIKEYYAKLCLLLSTSGHAESNVHTDFNSMMEYFKSLKQDGNNRIDWSNIYSRERIKIEKSKSVSQNKLEYDEKDAFPMDNRQTVKV